MNLFLIKKTYSFQAKAVIRLDSVKTEVVLRKHLALKELELVPITPAVLLLARKIATPLKSIQIINKLNESENF